MRLAGAVVALPAPAVLGVHLPLNAGPGVGSHPQGQADSCCCFALSQQSFGRGAFSYKTFKLLRFGFL